MKLLTKSFAILAVTASMAFAERTAAPEGAEVYFVNLEDGATVSAPVRVSTPVPVS